MSRLLVIPDIHNRVLWIESFLEKLRDDYDKIIFLGDYFDSWSDNPDDAEATAKWLKQSLQKPDRIHLWGNHDLPYKFPEHWCSGFTDEKFLAINTVLDEEDWKSLRFFHIEDGVHYTHGGIDERLFPFRGTNESYWQDLCEQREVSDLVALPESRGGTDEVGGILWCTWAELRFPKIKQICGHTIYNEPRVAFPAHSRRQNEFKAHLNERLGTEESWAINLDTESRHVAFVRDGRPEVATVLELTDKDFYREFRKERDRTRKRPQRRWAIHD